MKKIPETIVDLSSITNIITGFIQSNLLLTAIELKIFDYLSNPVNVQELSEKLGTHVKNTKVMLDGLTACNIIVKNKGRYQNTQIAETCLSSSKDTYLGEWVYLEVQAHSSIITDMAELIKNGPKQIIQEENMNSEEMCEVFTIAHARTGLAGISRQIAELISDLPEFSSFRKMLDLGGGPGINTIAVLSKNPKMKGVVFDREKIVKIAQKFIKEYGMSNRISVMDGDYNKDSIGNEYDLILISDTLYYSQDNVNEIMKKVYEALNPNGVVVALHGVLEHERTMPKSMVITMLPDALSGRGELPDSGFLSNAILKAGFKSIKTFKIENIMNFMEVDIARKSEEV